MNKKELITEIATQSQMTQKDVEKVLSCFFDAVGRNLANQEKIQIVGFGSFEVHRRKPRMGRNPKTGDSMEIAASNVPVFKAGKALKEKVNS